MSLLHSWQIRSLSAIFRYLHASISRGSIYYLKSEQKWTVDTLSIFIFYSVQLFYHSNKRSYCLHLSDLYQLLSQSINFISKRGFWAKVISQAEASANKSGHLISYSICIWNDRMVVTLRELTHDFDLGFSKFNFDFLTVSEESFQILL